MKIIFFDVETTGLPLSWKEKYTNKSNWPYIVQLAYIISYEDNEISEEQDYILKPEGFKIPEKSTNIHGISNELAIKKGNSRKEILHLFAAQIRSCDYVVAHNADFDINVLRCELLRNNIEDPFKKDMSIICTMKKSKDFCKLPSSYGDYKWPSLQELYAKLFNKSFKDAHNARFDVKATFECFWKLNQLNFIQVNKIKHSQGTVFNKNFLFSFFKKRGDIFYDLLSNYYPLDENLLCLLEAELNWDNVSENTEIEWNIDIIERFQDKWDSDVEHSGWPMGSIKWYGLSRNTSIPWSIELIKMFKDKWAFENPGEYNTGSLSTNQSLPWCDDLLMEFKDEWNWNELSSSSFLPWHEISLNKFIDKWNWDKLSSSPFLPWHEIPLDQFIDKWNWRYLSNNPALPWSIELISKNQDHWHWPAFNKMIVEGKINITVTEVMRAYFEDEISIKYMVYLPLNEHFLDLAIDSSKFGWEYLLGRGILPWTEELIRRYLPKMGSVTYLLNKSINWNIPLLHKFDEDFLWYSFAFKQDFNWDKNFFKEFEGRINFDEGKYDKYKINWKFLKKNRGIIWNEFLLERYYDNLKKDMNFWKDLSWNKLGTKWTPQIIEKYQEHWNWTGLSNNENICWSDELIYKYSEKWDWEFLSLNVAINWSDTTLEYYIDRFNIESFAKPSDIISKLLSKHSDSQFILDFLKHNPDISLHLNKIWEWSKLEINENFIVQMNNEIKK